MGWLLKLAGSVTGNPMLLVWIAAGSLALGVATGGGLAWKVQGWRLDSVKSEYAGFVSKTEAEGKIAQAEQDRIKKQHDKTLEDVSNAWNNTLKPVRDGAVAAYIAAHPVRVSRPDPGSGQVHGPSGSVQGNDGAGQEQVATGQTCEPDTRFIEDAAEDALKIGMWQRWATDNGLPIK